MNQVQPSRARILFAILFALFCWLLVGIGLPAPTGGVFATYLVAHLPFLALAVVLILSVKYVIGSSLKTLVTDHPTFRSKRFALAFVLYSGCALFFLLIEALRSPGTIQYHRAPLTQRLLFIALALLLTPIQTTAEEFLFRILPIRLLSHRPLRPSLWISLASALFFTLPHLSNQEVLLAADKGPVLAYYALFGFGMTFISLADGGFETALAVHAANNLHVALICNYHPSSLPSIPLFFTERRAGGWLELGQLLVSLALVAAGIAITRRRSRTPATSG